MNTLLSLSWLKSPDARKPVTAILMVQDQDGEVREHIPLSAEQTTALLSGTVIHCDNTIERNPS